MSELKTRAIHELKMEGDDGSILVAFAQTDAVDEDEDFTFAGAFKDKTVPISAFSHNSWPERGGELPTGKGSVSEIQGWAVLKGKFFTDTDHGRNTYLTVKAMGEDQQWSYGYDVLETAPVPHGIKARRGLKLLDTHEVSPVLLGAQPTAHTMAIKELKGAARDISEATYAMGTILRLVESEGRRGEDADVAKLQKIANSLSGYVAEHIGDVGTPEDLAELAAEAAASQAMSARYVSSSRTDPGLKGTPLAGETFDAHVTRLLGEVTDFDRRARGLMDIRLKEGRAISTARLTQFEEHANALLAAHKTFLEVIEAARPKPKEDGGAKLRRMRMEAQLGAMNLEITH